MNDNLEGDNLAYPPTHIAEIKGAAWTDHLPADSVYRNGCGSWPGLAFETSSIRVSSQINLTLPKVEINSIKIEGDTVLIEFKDYVVLSLPIDQLKYIITKMKELYNE